MKNWNDTTIDVKSVDWNGNPIIIRSVPAKQNPETKKIQVDPKDVVISEFSEIAKRNGIQDRDIMLFLLLYAKPGPFQRGHLSQKYKINKMLFYQWKELEKYGLGDVIPKDEFVAKNRGPVPKNLWEDLKRLKERGLLKVDGKRKEKKTVTVELTNEGLKLSKYLWDHIPDPYLGITTSVKNRFFPLNPETIKEIVHKEYPKYKKTYIYADREEKLLI